MEFDFSDDQKALGEDARRILLKEDALRAARQCLDDGIDFDSDLWSLAGELGWCGIAIPEAYGGIGLGHLELCVLAEELGRSLVPIPFASSIYFVAQALLEFGSEGQRKDYLPGLASGQTIATVAFAEGTGDLLRPPATVVRNGRLTGEKVAVVDGGSADLAVVLASGEEGPTLCLVDLHASGVQRTNNESIDPTQPIATLVFDKATADPLGDGRNGLQVAKKILARAAPLLAFEQIGIADACLEMSVEYAKGRFAFGRPIGSFQAIKHKLADIYVAAQLARSNAYYAAWALASRSAELELAAAAARVSAGTAAIQAATELIQVHGGIGFTWEMNCHLYYRRAKHLDLVAGSSIIWKRRLADAIEHRFAA